MTEVGPLKVCTCEVGSVEIGLSQISLTQVCSAQDCPTQIYLVQEGTLKACSTQVDSLHLGMREVYFSQIDLCQERFVEENTAPIGITHVHNLFVAMKVEEIRLVQKPQHINLPFGI